MKTAAPPKRLTTRKPHHSPDFNDDWNGFVKRWVAIGTEQICQQVKDGSVRLCSSISMKPRKDCSSRLTSIREVRCQVSGRSDDLKQTDSILLIRP